MPLELGAGTEGKALDHLLNQAAVYRDARGDTAGAITLLRRSVEIQEVTRRDEPLERATALSNLAGRLEEREATWKEAETCYRHALEIKERELSADDPSLAIILSNFGGLYWRKKDFSEAAKLTERAAKIDKTAHGEDSATYAIDLSNLGAIYSEWANATDDPALREKERDFKTRAATVTRAARGTRHPSMTARLNNLAIMHADAGDMAQAATDMAQCIAINLSLDQLAHPQTQQSISALIHLWTQSGQSEKAERLKNGDPSDLLPIIKQIEADHRAWVAEDPDNRHFGPPSPVTLARE
jgi:tetratricopeptide (TPR) repeat protein